MDNHKIPLLGHTLDELKAIAVDNGLPAFAGKQMAVWLYDKHVDTIEEMTNISKSNREKLAQRYEIGAAKFIDAQYSKDGTIKYLSQQRAVSLWKPCTYPTATAPRCAFRVKWAAK